MYSRHVRHKSVGITIPGTPRASEAVLLPSPILRNPLTPSGSAKKTVHFLDEALPSSLNPSREPSPNRATTPSFKCQQQQAPRHRQTRSNALPSEFEDASLVSFENPKRVTIDSLRSSMQKRKELLNSRADKQRVGLRKGSRKSVRSESAYRTPSARDRTAEHKPKAFNFAFRDSGFYSKLNKFYQVPSSNEPSPKPAVRVKVPLKATQGTLRKTQGPHHA